jgi:hypothetical protein
VGLNGTSVSTPQSEQVTFVISRGPLLPRKPPEFPLKFLSLKAILFHLRFSGYLVIKKQDCIDLRLKTNWFLITDDYTSLYFQHLYWGLKYLSLPAQIEFHSLIID